MGNYHDDLRVAAQDVVDSKESMERLSGQEPTDDLISNLHHSIDRLKKVLDSDEHYNF